MFNVMKWIFNLYYETLARLGFWIPVDKYMPPMKYYDWVIVSCYEPGMTYRYVPKIAEYSYNLNKWFLQIDNSIADDTLNNIYKITHWRKIPSDKHLKIK